MHCPQLLKLEIIQEQDALGKAQREIEIMLNKKQCIKFQQTAQVFHKGDV